MRLFANCTFAMFWVLDSNPDFVSAGLVIGTRRRLRRGTSLYAWRGASVSPVVLPLLPEGLCKLVASAVYWHG